MELEAGAIAEAMGEILGNPVLRKEMGKAGRELMESRYTWPVVARRCEGMYGVAMARREEGLGWRGMARRMAMPVMQLGRFAYHLF